MKIRIETVPISRILPAAYNPRKDLQPGDPEFQSLVRSIETFGCVEPLIWNRRTGNLVGGHQRLKVLIDRGHTKAQVSVVDLPLEQEKALNLALNRVQGDWDDGKLAALLNELTHIPDFDLGTTGFQLDEARDLIAEMLGPSLGLPAETFDPDAALKAASGVPPVTKPGDLIVLGRDPKRQHRLLCGNAMDAADVRKLMDGQRAALFATDPPYLVSYDGTNHPGKRAGGRGRTGKSQFGASKRAKSKPAPATGGNKDWSGTYGITWDDADGQPDLYAKSIHAAIGEALAPNCPWYWWHASRRQAMLERIWNDAGAFVHCQIIWVKNRPILTRTWYMWQHEPCLMGWLKGKKPPRSSDKHHSTVWQIDTLPNGAERPDHPTPKPLEVFEIPMRQHTRPGDVCYEPFAGSGTQIIAAQRLERRCFALEISPVYVDLCVRRFIALAGETAVTPEIAKKYRLPVKRGASA